MPTPEIIPTMGVTSKCFFYGNPLNFLNTPRMCVTIATHSFKEEETETQRESAPGASGW